MEIQSSDMDRTQQLSSISLNCEFIKCERVDDDHLVKQGNNSEHYFDDKVAMVDDVHIVYKKEPICEDDDSTQQSEYVQIIAEYEPALKTELEVETWNWEELAPIQKNDDGDGVAKNYECYLCQLVIETFRMLQKHLLKHRVNDLHRFKCKHCTKNFDNKRKLAKHIRYHTNGRSHICEICTKKCSSNIDLVAHLRIHTNEKPFGCDICSKTFKMRGDLNCHKRTHTGDKPYVCEICSKGFIRKSHLNRHNRLHTGATPYRCDVCSRTFRYKEVMDQHKRKHTAGYKAAKPERRRTRK